MNELIQRYEEILDELMELNDFKSDQFVLLKKELLDIIHQIETLRKTSQE